MQVKLVSVTQPLLSEKESLTHMTPEQLIVYCARVSSPTNQDNLDTSEKLLRFLIRNKHWSPFEMCDLTVEVETSRAIVAQILRHWSISFQEFSLRYAQAGNGFEVCAARLQGATNRQSSKEEGVSEELAAWWRISQEAHYEACNRLYQEALDRGIAKELARMVLPMATRTRIYMKASVRDWLFYLQARLDPHAQTEHRLVARDILFYFRAWFPTVCDAFFGEVAP